MSWWCGNATTSAAATWAPTIITGREKEKSIFYIYGILPRIGTVKKQTICVLPNYVSTVKIGVYVVTATCSKMHFTAELS
jgi:hypothetical protein